MVGTCRGCTGSSLQKKLVKAPKTKSSAEAANGTGLQAKSNGTDGKTSVRDQSGNAASGRLQPAILQPFLDKAADAESKHHYRMAASIYEQAGLSTQFGCLPS